jgi:hypothetical protein
VAQVDPATRADVDRLLDQAVASWEELAEVEREIDRWRLEDQLVFTEEWPIEEKRLRRLVQHARSNDFTAAQGVRYRELLNLVERHRPVLERIMRG